MNPWNKLEGESVEDLEQFSEFLSDQEKVRITGSMSYGKFMGSSEFVREVGGAEAEQYLKALINQSSDYSPSSDNVFDPEDFEYQGIKKRVISGSREMYEVKVEGSVDEENYTVTISGTITNRNPDLFPTVFKSEEQINKTPTNTRS